MSLATSPNVMHHKPATLGAKADSQRCERVQNFLAGGGNLLAGQRMIHSLKSNAKKQTVFSGNL